MKKLMLIASLILTLSYCAEDNPTQYVQNNENIISGMWYRMEEICEYRIVFFENNLFFRYFFNVLTPESINELKGGNYNFDNNIKEGYIYQPFDYYLIRVYSDTLIIYYDTPEEYIKK